MLSGCVFCVNCVGINLGGKIEGRAAATDECVSQASTAVWQKAVDIIVANTQSSGRHYP